RVGEGVEGEHAATQVEAAEEQQQEERQDEGELDERLTPAGSPRSLTPAKQPRHGLLTVIVESQATCVPLTIVCDLIFQCAVLFGWFPICIVLVKLAAFQMPWAELMATPPLLVKFGTVHVGGGVLAVTVIVGGADVVLRQAFEAVSTTVYVPGVVKVTRPGSWA